MGAVPVTSIRTSPVVQVNKAVAVVDVALADRVMVLAVKPVIVVPAGMPVPVMVAPFFTRLVLATPVMVFDPLVMVPVVEESPIRSKAMGAMIPLKCCPS